jgi:hypothetical protein
VGTRPQKKRARPSRTMPSGACFFCGGMGEALHVLGIGFTRPPCSLPTSAAVAPSTDCRRPSELGGAEHFYRDEGWPQSHRTGASSSLALQDCVCSAKQSRAPPAPSPGFLGALATVGVGEGGPAPPGGAGASDSGASVFGAQKACAGLDLVSPPVPPSWVSPPPLPLAAGGPSRSCRNKGSATNLVGG